MQAFPQLFFQINRSYICEHSKLFVTLQPYDMIMEAALGVDAAPLLAMQNEYDMLMAERDASFMEKLKQIRRIAAIF